MARCMKSALRLKKLFDCRGACGVIVAVVVAVAVSSAASGVGSGMFDAPVSSRECRERLAMLGASESGVELARSAIDAYVQLILQRPAAVSSPAFLPSPLDIAGAQKVQQSVDREIAEADAADALLTNGILSAMSDPADRQAAARFKRWIELRRDRICFRVAGLQTGPLDFSIQSAIAPATTDSAVIAELLAILADHDASIAQMSRAARDALLATPMRTARLAQERSPVDFEADASNLQALLDRGQAIIQVRYDGIEPVLKIFQKIGSAQRSTVNRIATHLRDDARWKLWTSLFERAYQLQTVERVAIDKIIKDLKTPSRLDAQSHAALLALEEQWRKDCIATLSALASLDDDAGWNPFIHASAPIQLPSDLDSTADGNQMPEPQAVSTRERVQTVLSQQTKVLRDQLADMDRHAARPSAPDNTGMDMPPEQLEALMQMQFGSMCFTDWRATTAVGNLIELKSASEDQRRLVSQVQQDARETSLRAADELASRWQTIGGEFTTAPDDQKGALLQTAFEAAIQVRQESIQLDRSNAELFLSRLDQVLSNPSGTSHIDFWRASRLREIERNQTQCLAAQVAGVRINPLWRVDFESIALSSDHPESNDPQREALWLAIRDGNAMLLPLMRALSDALIDLIAATQLTTVMTAPVPTATTNSATGWLQSGPLQPRQLSKLEIRLTVQNAAVQHCQDLSQQIAVIQNATLAQIIANLPTREVPPFMHIVYRAGYPELAAYLGQGDQWLTKALLLTRDDPARGQAIIDIASVYGPKSDSLFKSAVDQQEILDGASQQSRPAASESLRRTLFARQELDSNLRRDVTSALGPDLAGKLGKMR